MPLMSRLNGVRSSNKATFFVLPCNMIYTGEQIKNYLSCFPQAMIWFEPVFDELSMLKDFRFMYFNAGALQYIGHPEQELKGLLISEAPFMDDWLQLKLLEKLKEVYLTNKADEGGYTIPC
jgi:hypothetical protein